MAEYNQTFETHTEWVNKASSWLTRHPKYQDGWFQAVCFDAKGRHCNIGRDFARARDEDAFPVRWLWPDQIAAYFRANETHINDAIVSDPLFA